MEQFVVQLTLTHTHTHKQIQKYIKIAKQCTLHCGFNSLSPRKYITIDFTETKNRIIENR